jgi:DNA modification methylase
LIQQELFENTVSVSPQPDIDMAEWGTFKDSLKAPVHRWFTYPAGFSYKSVHHSIKSFGISMGQTIYDPFMGSGTTNLTAKTLGINSCGVEAHPFVFKIAQAKLNWDIKTTEVSTVIDYIQNHFKTELHELMKLPDFDIEHHFPELLLKCYEKKTLIELLVLRNIISNIKLNNEGIRHFFFVVVTALLRQISTAATGWPYIAPNKTKSTSVHKNVLVELSHLARSKIEDIELIKFESKGRFTKSEHLLIHGDARNTKEYIKETSIDHVFTSPPYLNNFDYADRTRLELYFWGEAKTWGDISKEVRAKLMTSATTQIVRNDNKYRLSQSFQTECPKITEFVSAAVYQLSELRKTKGGKKSYDLMVAGYFNDIYQVIKEVYRVLKPNTKALFVLGDSAPYGVHIPTDRLIGDIGLCVGFNDYNIEVLRKRGDKWKNNPQRHRVSLRESIVILSKK